MLVVILFNVVIFVIVLSVLIKHSKKKIERAKASSDGSSRAATIRLLISIFSIMNLYGLTWLFAIFTFGDHEGQRAFRILFAIFNSLQGFFMFVFFCVLGKEARDSWAKILCRGKLKRFAPNISTSRPGAQNTSSAQPNTGRRKSAQTTGTVLRSSIINSYGRKSSLGRDTLRSLSSPRPSISEEPSSVSIHEDYSSSGPNLIEINPSAIAMDTLDRSRLTKMITPMLTLDEADEEEDSVIHPGGNFGIVEMLEPPLTGGDSASVSGASLAESGIMIDDEIVCSSPNDFSSPQPSEHQEAGGYIMERPQPADDQEAEDESEVLQNPHAI